MEKIIVIGSPGAGKSLFSKKLKNIMKLPLYHIDMMYHKKDGTHITKEELEALKELVELYPDTFFQGTPSMEKKLATNVLKNL